MGVPETSAPSPLQEIETVVQQRANQLAIDVDTPEGEDHLRTLIEEAIESWSEDHLRGLREHALPDPGAMTERAFCNLARSGPLTSLLDDEYPAVSVRPFLNARFILGDNDFNLLSLTEA